MAPIQREVNTEEVIKAENIPDGTTVPDEEDEEVIPPVVEPADETKPAPASSPEGTKTEPEEPEAVIVPSKPEPAPVEGESQREKALRLELTRVKGQLRIKSVADLVEGAKEAPLKEDHIGRLKNLGYSDEEISKASELVDVLATSKGYVKAEHTYQTVVQDTVDAFLESKPEYKPENDKDDLRWGRFQEILKSGIYNLSGKTSKQLRSIFDHVNKDIVDEFGESVQTTDAAKRAAQQQKIRSVSHSGGTKVVQTEIKKAIAPEIRAVFKGFEDDDLV